MLTHAECIKQYGSDYQIQKEIKSGRLFHVGKGVYSHDQHVPKLAILAYKYPKAILTMRNAFYYHGLTDVIPRSYDLATDRDAAKIPDRDVRQYFYPDNFLADGAEKMDYKGYEIMVYNRERMLIELLRYKSKLPFDYYSEIIHSYREIVEHLDIRKVEDYAMASPKAARILSTLQIEVM